MCGKWDKFGEKQVSSGLETKWELKFCFCNTHSRHSIQDVIFYSEDSNYIMQKIRDKINGVQSLK